MLPVLIELQYLPEVRYFSLLARQPVVWLEQHEHYVKGTYRNRCHIAAVNGVQRLSVPLRKGKNEQQPIREVQIAYDEPWQLRHWQAIQSAYGRSPFFLHYADELQPFFKEKKYRWLWDLNFDLLVLLMKHASLKTEIRLTENYRPHPDEMSDFRGKIHPKQNSASGDLLSPRYSQVFEDRLGFLKNLSVLDLLFCTGPAARGILKSELLH